MKKLLAGLNIDKVTGMDNLDGYLKLFVICHIFNLILKEGLIPRIGNWSRLFLF